MNRSKNRFTLVELLVVIAIIAILAAILLPTIGLALRKVRVGRAKVEIASLVTAMKMYEGEYDLMPIKYDSTKESEVVANYDQLIGILSQTGTYKNDGNSRKTKMLDVVKAGKYQDPWEQNYRVIVDTDADDEIDSGDVVGMATGQVIPTAIVIWSPGPDGEFDSTPKDSKNKDNVYSIETNWDKNNGHVLP